VCVCVCVCVAGSENKSYPLRRMLLQYRVKRALLQVWPIQASMPLNRVQPIRIKIICVAEDINDPVLSSLKMEGTRLLLLVVCCELTVYQSIQRTIPEGWNLHC
jgi:hypothetical protein